MLWSPSLGSVFGERLNTGQDSRPHDHRVGPQGHSAQVGSPEVLERHPPLPAAVSLSSLVNSAHWPSRCHGGGTHLKGEGCWRHSIQHLCPPYSGWFLHPHLTESLGIPQALSSNLSQQLEPTHPRREGLAEMPAYLGSSVGPSEASPAKEL